MTYPTSKWRLPLYAAALALIGAGASCRLLGGKPDAEGVSSVRSVGKPAAEWRDDAGGIWRAHDEPLTWIKAARYCAGLGAATQRRWRLPSIDELLEARESGIGTVKNKSFGWVELGNTWAADWEKSFGRDTSGGYVDMEAGRPYRVVYNDIENTTVCVRTDLFGNVWDDGKGRSWWYVPATMDFETAQVTCAELARRLHKPWRLPTPEELEAATKSGIQTRVNKAFGRDYIRYTWTRSIGARVGSEEAYATDLRAGVTHLTDIDEEIAVVCTMPSKTP